jgi:hypothetical protein
MTSSVSDRPAGSQTIPHFLNVLTGSQTHPPMFGWPASVSRKVFSFSIFDAFLLTSKCDYDEEKYECLYLLKQSKNYESLFRS